MSTVYRIEDVDHSGPYTGFNMLSKEFPSWGNMPTPDIDSGINRWPRSYEFCGFNSMQQLSEWFTEHELAWLFNKGYNVVKLDDIEITATGEHQVLFVREPVLT